MVNYKNIPRDVYTFQGLARAYDTASKKPIVLSYNYSLIGTPISVFEGASVYTVTSGKTLKILGCILEKATATSSNTIHEGDTQDAQTTLKTTMGLGGLAGTYDIALDIEIASGKYVTFDSSATNKIYSVTIIGYET